MRNLGLLLAASVGLIGLLTGAVIGCAGASDESPAQLRGREVYLSTCIACHNADPALSGALGPPIKGSSRDLIAARVLRAEYPPGYAPKRTTRQMVPLPKAAPYIDDLAEFLK